ncbi:Peptide deformylase protein [Dioscorea alata]|uniref:Peptide deformylase protein n=1 Tax=Dioscorea alata TaxID=55571 RepID=A0ACB7WDD0_DIOAL|nr:Peptide deformylase protein [Dioscorea alata]
MAARGSVSHNALLSLLPRRAVSLLPRPMLSPRAPSRLLRPSKVLAMARRGFSSQEDDFASPNDLRFEPPLKIVEYPHPILRARNKGINTFDENLKKLADEMFDVMYKTDGIGLSAPQVGINVQLMVFNPAGERGEGEEIILVNPIVYRVSKKTVLFNEGCLSFPGIYADVEGVLFFDRMTEEVLSSIRSQLKALEVKYESQTGLQSPERIDDYKRRKEVAGFGRA